MVNSQYTAVLTELSALHFGFVQNIKHAFANTGKKLGELKDAVTELKANKNNAEAIAEPMEATTSPSFSWQLPSNQYLLPNSTTFSTNTSFQQKAQPLIKPPSYYKYPPQITWSN